MECWVGRKVVTLNRMRFWVGLVEKLMFGG